MGFLSQWRERRAIRRALRLRKRLRSLYGRAPTYPPGRVRRAAAEDRLSPQSAPWALAIHCSRADFEASGEPGDYGALRRRVEEAALPEPMGFDAAEGIPRRYETALGATALGGFWAGGGDGAGGADGGGAGGDGGGGGL